MSGTAVYEDPRAIDRLYESIQAPPVLVIRTRIFVHDRAPPGSPRCGCGACEFTTAQLSEVIPDLELAIDRASGRRVHRSQVRPETWARLVEGAEAHDIPLVTFRSQLEIVTATDRLLLVDGGAQSGKTEALARWFLRQILIRGGQGKTAWLLAPSRRSCFIQASKALLGYQGRPPLLPPSLVVRAPRLDTDAVQKIILIDGTQIDLRPTDRKDGSRADGQECICVWFDEVTKSRYQLYWGEAQNRTTATRGPVAASTTPLPGHWYEPIVQAAIDVDKRREEGEEGLPSSRHWTITRFDNLAISEEAIEEQVRLLEASHGPSAVRLHVFGEWVRGDAMPYWRHWRPDEMVRTHVPRDIRLERHPKTGEPFVDVTASAIEIAAPGGNWFSGEVRAANRRWILGLDVNQSPISAVVCQIWAPSPGAPHDQWGLFVVDEVSRDYATLSEFAGVLTSVEQGSYRSCVVIVDPQNCHTDQSILASGGLQRGNASAKALVSAGLDARPAAFSVRPGQHPVPHSPSRRDSHELLHRLMLEGRLFVSSRCARLIEGLRDMEADPTTNLPVKKPGNRSDKISNAVDGLRYLAWSIWGTRPEISHRFSHRQKPVGYGSPKPIPFKAH